MSSNQYFGRHKSRLGNSNPPLPEFHVEWSENCLITPYPYLHLVLISIYLFIHLHISMSITFYAFLDRFDRPIRLNVRPFQLASARIHHSSPLKSHPLSCSFRSSQQSTPPFDPQPRTFHYSFLFKSPFRSQAFPARFCLIPRTVVVLFQEICLQLGTYFCFLFFSRKKMISNFFFKIR